MTRKLPYDPEAWNKLAPEYAKQIVDRQESAYYAPILDAISNAYEPGMKVLEVACAGGHDFRYLNRRKRIEPKDFTGLDVTEPYLKLAKERYPDCRWVLGDARKLPFENKEFDITYNLLMLLHLDKEGVQQALQEMCRVTRSKVFILTYVSDVRHECWTKVKQAEFRYDVISREEMEIPGWELVRLVDEPMPHKDILRYMPFDIVIYHSHMLRRIT